MLPAMSRSARPAPLWRPLIWLAVVLLLLEEWLWDRSACWLGRLAVWLRLSALEARIARLPPWPALIALALPSLVILPAKVAGLTLLAHGHVLASIGVLVLAKLAGTALLARVFALVRTQVLRLRWAAVAHRTVTGLLAWAHARLDQMPAAREARARLRGWRRRLARTGGRSAVRRAARRIVRRMARRRRS